MDERMKDRIRLCASTNWGYMATTAAGHVPGLEAMTRLYDRLATQGYSCAQAWLEERPVPEHEPAVDAFWWGVASWAGAFPKAILRWGGYHDQELYDELEWRFWVPHWEFARWLKPVFPECYQNPTVRAGALTHCVWRLILRPWPVYRRPPEIILRYDAHWTWRVILLTARWGLLHHLKRDAKALWEALFLMRRLRRWPDPVAVAYLESDLTFLRELFGHFDFSPRLRAIIENFLAVAEKEAHIE